jgi:predicted LPLAT superfamily acyltransferase
MTSWLQVREVGTVFAIRLLVLVATAFGRTAARGVVRMVAFYYTLFAGGARRASREYYRRLGFEWGFWTGYRHILHFAFVVLDRMFLVRGKVSLFSYTRNGQRYLEELREARQGAVLIGSHLGSFEMLRGASVQESLPINIVGYFKNARMINAVLHRLAPELRVRLIHVEPGDPAFAFTLKERLEQGEIVSIMGDRAGLSERSAEASFLGGRARFPTGPLLLAALLRCPVYLTFGLYRGKNHYDLYCEPFADPIVLPRREREARLEAYVQRYADRLAHFCRIDPRNWFNFFDFWSSGAASVDPP